MLFLANFFNKWLVKYLLRVGVETKKSVLGAGSKANHLTYIGDSVIGTDVNVGAGSITCNYDGFGKFKTIIGDGASIGSNTALVAPVKIGAGAIIGAGSTITANVPNDAIATTRSALDVRHDAAEYLGRLRAGRVDGQRIHFGNPDHLPAGLHAPETSRSMPHSRCCEKQIISQAPGCHAEVLHAMYPWQHE